MTEISRRDFFKSLAASVIAAGAVLPVGLSTLGWRKVTGLEYEQMPEAQRAIFVGADKVHSVEGDYTMVRIW